MWALGSTRAHHAPRHSHDAPVGPRGVALDKLRTAFSLDAGVRIQARHRQGTPGASEAPPGRAEDAKLGVGRGRVVGCLTGAGLRARRPPAHLSMPPGFRVPAGDRGPTPAPVSPSVSRRARPSCSSPCLSDRPRRAPDGGPVPERIQIAPVQASAADHFRPPNHRPARTTIHCLLTTRIEILILRGIKSNTKEGV
jgi:hypothetical protein